MLNREQALDEARKQKAALETIGSWRRGLFIAAATFLVLAVFGLRQSGVLFGLGVGAAVCAALSCIADKIPAEFILPLSDHGTPLSANAVIIQIFHVSIHNPPTRRLTCQPTDRGRNRFAEKHGSGERTRLRAAPGLRPTPVTPKHFMLWSNRMLKKLYLQLC